MGFLDRFKGGNDFTVSVSSEQPDVSPGGELTLRFDVGGELDEKCRGIRVGITGTGKYEVEERDRDSNGNVRTRKVWQTVEIHEEEHSYPAQIGPGTAKLTLPSDAPQSAVDAVEWEIFARVDRKGFDKVERQPVHVRLSDDQVSKERTPPTSDDGVTIVNVPVAVQAGGQIDGTVSITPSDDVTVTAARIRIHRRVTYVANRIDDYNLYRGTGVLGSFVLGGGTSRITNDEKVAEVDLSGKREFAAGQTEQLAFSVQVPAHLGGTSAHQYATVDWRIEAVLDRRMRGDLAVDTPIVVY